MLIKNSLLLYRAIDRLHSLSLVFIQSRMTPAQIGDNHCPNRGSIHTLRLLRLSRTLIVNAVRAATTTTTYYVQSVRPHVLGGLKRNCVVVEPTQFISLPHTGSMHALI